MRPFQLFVLVLLLVSIPAPARADSAPPEGPCTVAFRSSSDRQCVECTAVNCATTVPEGYRWECSPSEPGGGELWCEPYPDEGGCRAASRGVSGRSGQVLLVVLLLLVGFVFHRRSRSEK